MNNNYFDQLTNGFIVTIIGASLVFLFLIILIFAIQIMSKLVQKYRPITEPPIIQDSQSTNDKEKEALAIAIASQYKKS